MPVCQECGASFVLKLKRPKSSTAFCSEPCRKAFNNRRSVRGAEIYDLLMSERFDRETQLEAQKMMRRRASEYRQEDKDRRAGRKSWRPLREVVQRKPTITFV